MKDGKLFGIINILDLAIIVVIVVAGVILAPNFIGKSEGIAFPGSSTGSVTVYFTVEFPQTSQSFAEKIKIGDLINDNTRGYYYGTAEKIEVVQSTVTRGNPETGQFIEAEIPEKVDVLLTVKCNGTENDKDILAEGQPIKVGKNLVLKGKGYAAAGYVVGLRTEKSGTEGVQ